MSSVLAQCYSDNGGRGFRLHYSSGVKLNWNIAQATTARVNKREMLVIRHKKGDSNLYIYGSNAENDSTAGVITEKVMENTFEVNHDSTLVFGCSRTDDGYYENNAVGTIYWSKIWYTDLGEYVCKELAAYPHEKLNLVVGGFRRFYLSEVSNKRSSITLVANRPLSNYIPYSSGSYSTSWESSVFNIYLNDKVYRGFPVEWR